MKKIISLFTVVIIMATVCTTGLINAKAISFELSKVPNAPGSTSTTTYITINRNECDLRISNMVNCNVIVTFPTINKSPIIIYSPSNYHINFTPYNFNNSFSLNIDLLPIDKNLPSYCSGTITTT